MNRLLFGDNLNWLRDTKVFPDAHPDSMSRQASVTFNVFWRR